MSALLEIDDDDANEELDRMMTFMKIIDSPDMSLPASIDLAKIIPSSTDHFSFDGFVRQKGMSQEVMRIVLKQRVKTSTLFVNLLTKILAEHDEDVLENCDVGIAKLVTKVKET